MLRKVSVEELELGMYVSELDRPWTETPFLFQGFFLQSEADIEEVRRHCRYAYVDPAKAHPALSEAPGARAAPAASPEARPLAASRPLLQGRGGQRYEEAVPVGQEVTRAQQAYSDAYSVLAEAFHGAFTSGKVNVPAVHEAVAGIMHSVLRNPNAFTWVTRVRRKDEYLYEHLVSTCGLAAAFGRHLGLPPEDLQALTLGALLFDIGMIEIPREIRHKAGRLDAGELEQIRGHTEAGVRILEASGGFSRAVLDVVRHHHERHDGSGYPDGRGSEDTPLFAQIVGLAECYDAMTSDRPYRAATSPHEALKAMYHWRGHEFHADLVEEFIQSLGVYPTGTLVELTSGQIGVVIAQNPLLRLRPKIVLLFDAEGARYDIHPALDLAAETTDHLGNPLEIRRAVSPDQVGVDLTELDF
ncbi:MAG: HD-GYP domain-containing protein [Gammaproteobacteria bacterium]|nr:HD-GYP domain-containing protein [Gammaproteobacteria bacterium]